MVEKRRRKGCGKGCLRCWRNNLVHNNPRAKAFAKRNGEDFDIKFRRKGAPRMIRSKKQMMKLKRREKRKKKRYFRSQSQEKKDQLVELRGWSVRSRRIVDFIDEL